MQMSKRCCTRTLCNLFFTSKSRHANAIKFKPPDVREFSLPSSQLLESTNLSIITTHSRQKHRQYLGKLLLSPPPTITSHFNYYRKVHAQIILCGFESNIFLSNILIAAYSKNGGSLQSAANVFARMPQRNLISWSSMISAYNQNGYDEEALLLFLEFRIIGDENPNEFILTTVVQSCTQLSDVENGTCLHCFVIKAGYNQNGHVATSLIDFYVKTGDLGTAGLVFDVLEVKSVVTWTAIIMGFSMNGRCVGALDLFKEMVETGGVPDKYALSSVLNACSMLELLDVGKQVHAYVLRSGANMDASVSNILIDFYAKHGKVRIGHRIFEQMAVKNGMSWTTMISGYMQNGLHHEAMNLFKDMNMFEWEADGFACTSVLTSCGSVGALDQGKQVHAYTVKVNLDSHEFVNNSLIDMYSKCSSLLEAESVFLASAKCSAICYNAMIEGYSRHGILVKAFDLFNQMMHNLIPPTVITFVSLLGVSDSEIALSRQIHSLMIKFGFCLNSFSGSALIDVYSQFSCLSDARHVFEEIGDEKDIVVWNSILFGYALHSENENALRLYLNLLYERERPNAFTFVAVIMAFSNLASLSHGVQIHSQAVKVGLDFDPFVTNTLMDMYANCGYVDAAQVLFNCVHDRDTACWNTMISLHAHHGNAENALHMFKQMKGDGIRPDNITFVGVLSACAHVGLVEEGFHHFNSMSEFGIQPGEGHYSSMVSLLGKAGKLREAMSFIENMTIQPTATIWKSLLSACRVTGDVELGQYAAEMAISCDQKDSGPYVLLSNIFASNSMWIDAKKVREDMDRNNVVKEPGNSWI